MRFGFEKKKQGGQRRTGKRAGKWKTNDIMEKRGERTAARGAPTEGRKAQKLEVSAPDHLGGKKSNIDVLVPEARSWAAGFSDADVPEVARWSRRTK